VRTPPSFLVGPATMTETTLTSARPGVAEPPALAAVGMRSQRRGGAIQSRIMTAATVRTICLGGVLVLAAVVPYLNTLSAGFTFDDKPTILENRMVTGGIDVVGTLASPLRPGDLYRPLAVLTFAVNEALAPGQARWFHAVNVGLHAAVSVLVFLLVYVLTGTDRLALVAGALFAVLPVHTEAVASLVGRAELLAALFGLGSLVAVARAATGAPSPGRRVALEWLGLGLFALALVSKESALTVAILVPLARVTARREPLGGGLWRELRTLDWIPYGLVVAVFLVARGAAVSVFPAEPLHPLNNPLGFVPWWTRVLTALGVLWEYFGLLTVPIVLSADYSYNQVPLARTWWDPRVLAGVALVGTAAAVVLRSRRPVLRFAVLFPFVALALTANVLFPIGTIKAERLLYLPSVGVVLLMALAAAALARHERYRRVATVGTVVVLAAYAGRTWTRNADWRDNAALYRSMARTAPDSAKAHYNYGVTLQEADDEEAAVAQYEQALSIFEAAEGAAFGIGLAFDRRQQPEQAVVWYRRALAILPDFERPLNNLCRLFLLTQQYTEAERVCRAGLRYHPTNANLMLGLGEALAGRGEPARAVRVLQRAAQLDPTAPGPRMRLAELGAPSDAAPPSGSAARP